jgi:putative transposase
MRYSQPEKMEIIRLVERSSLSVKRTLEELDINRSTFYQWYQRYLENGYDGLADRKPTPRKFWNKIPENVKEQIVDIALEYPEKSPRELAWFITDNEGYFISESSVYRILKACDLITSPAYILISAKDKFDYPTKRVNELWQTDFSYFHIKGWGWYYLSTVMDDYSRFILSWKLFPTMSATDVQETLDMALKKTGVDQVKVRLRPRLLSDNGPCYISKDLKDYLDRREITHIRSAPYHPQTQGKIERYHLSIKNVINLDNYYIPEELERAIKEYVNYYNHHRYHESLDNLTPADVYYGRSKVILDRRAFIKEQTLKMRCCQNLKIKRKKIILDYENCLS